MSTIHATLARHRDGVRRPRPEFAEALLRHMQQVEQPQRRTTPTIRYFVKDIETAVDFYRQHLAFD